MPAALLGAHGAAFVELLADGSTERAAAAEALLAKICASAASEALRTLANDIERTAARTDNTFTEHSIADCGGVEMIREYTDNRYPGI